MGMSCKPFMKIEPREAAIRDSTITCFLQEGGIIAPEVHVYDLIKKDRFVPTS